MVDATCIFFSRPGEAVSEVFRRSKRIYEKFDHPHEWTLDYQGSLIGYSPREVLLRPDSSLALESHMALSWSPSVGAARTEDTVIIDNRGYEVVTEDGRLAADRGRRQGLRHPPPGNSRAVTRRGVHIAVTGPGFASRLSWPVSIPPVATHSWPFISAQCSLRRAIRKLPRACNPFPSGCSNELSLAEDEVQ